MMEVVVTTGSIRCAKLQSNVTTNKPTPSFLEARCPSYCPNNHVKALKVRPFFLKQKLTVVVMSSLVELLTSSIV